MKKFKYSVSSCNIWTSFDNGEVKADDDKHALSLAEKELDYNFAKANAALSLSSMCKGFSISFDPNQIRVEEVK